MKPKFQLRMQTRALRANTKTEVVMARKFTNSKNDQIEEAVQCCLESNVWGHTALQTGRFPTVKDQETSNRRLDGKIITGSY